MFWIALIICWLAVMPVTGILLARFLARRNPEPGLGRHVEFETRAISGEKIVA